MGNEIEHDHTLHESLHHNEHRQHPSCVAIRHIDPEILTGRSLGIHEVQEVYQTAIHANYGTYGSPPVFAARFFTGWCGPKLPVGPANRLRTDQEPD